MTTPTEFHSFNQLPYQLRDKIWKLVLRPLDRAGAHFFNVEEREKQEDIGSFQQHDISITSLRMASPYWLHTCVGNTPKRNRSIYMVDSGLWTACKESRELMKKTFRPEISNHSTSGFCISSSLADSLSSGSPSFSSENAITVQRRYFTVCQNQDLFIYWKLNWSSPAWWDRVLNDGDPRDFLKKLGHYQKHLAIEWDPALRSTGPYNITSALGRATVNRGPVEGRIWFIEYSLRPKPNMVIIPRQHVFHDNIGGRYVEVCTFHNKYDENRPGRSTDMVFDDISSYTLNPAGEFPQLYTFIWNDVTTRISRDWFSQGRYMGSLLDDDRREYAMLGVLAYLPPGSQDYNYDPIRDARKLKIRHYGKPMIQRDWIKHLRTD